MNHQEVHWRNHRLQAVLEDPALNKPSMFHGKSPSTYVEIDGGAKHWQGFGKLNHTDSRSVISCHFITGLNLLSTSWQPSNFVLLWIAKVEQLAFCWKFVVFFVLTYHQLLWSPVLVTPYSPSLTQWLSHLLFHLLTFYTRILASCLTHINWPCTA